MDNHSNQQMVRTLKEIGLKPNEISIYLTLLTTGENTAGVIAKRSGINRCSCYTIIERLIKRGFIGQISKNNINYYTPVNPSNILNHLKAKQYELEKKIYILGKNITKLEPIKKDHSAKPKVVFFEGLTGIKNILEDSLNSEGGIKAYLSIDELNEILPEYLPHYFERCIQKQLTVKTILPASEISYLHKINLQRENHQIRLVPQDFNFHLNLLIYSGKIALTPVKANFGIIIENQDLFESKNSIFEFIWNTSALFDKIMTTSIAEKIALKKAPRNYPLEPF